jgi:CheY-like chemotaxis protein
MHPAGAMSNLVLMHGPECVLIVDDNPRLLATIGEALKASHMAPRLANDGDDALEALHGGLAPDAIIIDLDMKRPPGMAVLARIQGDPDGGDLPVLALGSHPNSLLNAGRADAVLLKPFEVEQLRRRLVEICDVHPLQ